ncbi:MAG TPA: MarR family transcriptional regulator [Candidatus Limnocylindrales bacterium]|nr:MarR family transcriptional regulator [Candidatus Limnocylindrales bacterium]
MTLTKGRREAIVDAVIDELTNWNPRERMGMFRKWLAGSLSIVQLHVLTILEASGPVPMGKLADALDVSVASATGIVDRMEQRGLVERRGDESDRRVVLVHATDAGMAVFNDLAQMRRAGLVNILERLTNDELKALLIGLRAMSKARAAQLAEAEEAMGTGGARAAAARS